MPKVKGLKELRLLVKQQKSESRYGRSSTEIGGKDVCHICLFLLTVYNSITYYSFLYSCLSRHSRESGNPGVTSSRNPENTGFRIKCRMTHRNPAEDTGKF
jgi:hypothetical protein